MSEQSLETLLKSAREYSVQSLYKLLQRGRRKGFESYLNRKQIWPFLLKLQDKGLSSGSFQWQAEVQSNSSDYDQLQKDAQRALSSMKIFDNITKFHLQKRQKDVLKILNSFFAKNKNLKYIQGFHDVASVFIVLFGNNTGYYLMQKAGKTYFRDFLTQDIGQLGSIYSQMVNDLLIRSDKQFQQIFQPFKQMNMLIFLIPWVLTWFSHVFSSVKTICRIWDYLFCTGPFGIIYLSAGIILKTKEQLILSSPELDHASIISFYQKLAKQQNLDIQGAIKKAIQLQQKYPGKQLKGYQKLDRQSIFNSQIFERQIDLIRQAKQYSIIEEKNQQKKKITYAIITSAVLGLGVAAYYFKFMKRSL